MQQLLPMHSDGPIASIQLLPMAPLWPIASLACSADDYSNGPIEISVSCCRWYRLGPLHPWHVLPMHSDGPIKFAQQQQQQLLVPLGPITFLAGYGGALRS